MFFQVCSELGIPDNAWHKIRTTTALTVDDLGNEFRLLFSAGWLAYIHTGKTYGAAQTRQSQSVGQEPVVVDE